MTPSTALDGLKSTHYILGFIWSLGLWAVALLFPVMVSLLSCQSTSALLDLWKMYNRDQPTCSSLWEGYIHRHVEPTLGHSTRESFQSLSTISVFQMMVQGMKCTFTSLIILDLIVFRIPIDDATHYLLSSQFTVSACEMKQWQSSDKRNLPEETTRVWTETQTPGKSIKSCVCGMYSESGWETAMWLQVVVDCKELVAIKYLFCLLLMCPIHCGLS